LLFASINTNPLYAEGYRISSLENNEKYLELLIKDKEGKSAENVDVKFCFFGSLFPFMYETKSKEDGKATLYLDELYISHKKMHGSIFYSKRSAEEYINKFIEKDLTSSGNDYLDIRRIDKTPALEDLVQEIGIAVVEKNSEGQYDVSDSRNINLDFKKINMGKIYEIARNKIKEDVRKYTKPVRIEFEVLDEDTRKEVEGIKVRFSPIKTKTFGDMNREQYNLRKKYFVENSDLFRETEVDSFKEFKFVYNDTLNCDYGRLSFTVPANSVYELEFVDSYDDARYRGFVTKVSFNGDKKSRVYLERLGQRVEIDARHSRGRIEEIN
jgi:hypothetical protein